MRGAVVSLNVAFPSKQRYEGRELLTGGAKRAVERAMLRFENFDGDGQADRVNHGGADKAVCVYSFDHYPHWEEVLRCRLSPGAFSENLTVSGVSESEVCVGDVYRVGGATVQVSQPRMPCSKLAGKNEERLLTRWIAQTGYTGFYLRVLAEGVVSSGDAFELVGPHPERISVADVNDVIYERSKEVGLLERLATMPEFAAGGRALFARRVANLRREKSA